MKKTFQFGKIDFYGTGRKINAVEVTAELTEGGVFKASGIVWNLKHSDVVCYGQCLDDIKLDNPLFKEIRHFWHLYHLNDMNVGTPAQKRLVKGLDYDTACEVLKENNLYIDNGYRYGSGWLFEAIPDEDLKRIKELLTA